MAHPLGILLISGEPGRAHYAFVLAAGAAALGRTVVLFATNEGTRALCADITDLDAMPRPACVAGIGELRAAAVDLGVRLIACETGLLMAGLAPTRLLEGVEVAGVATFLAAIGPGQMLTM
ncbi:MAG: DsrE/DsrF/DrsH-like family protein [Acetobacteraceae bacterium]